MPGDCAEELSTLRLLLGELTVIEAAIQNQKSALMKLIKKLSKRLTQQSEISIKRRSDFFVGSLNKISVDTALSLVFESDAENLRQHRLETCDNAPNEISSKESCASTNSLWQLTRQRIDTYENCITGALVCDINSVESDRLSALDNKFEDAEKSVPVTEAAASTNDPIEELLPDIQTSRPDDPGCLTNISNKVPDVDGNDDIRHLKMNAHVNLDGLICNIPTNKFYNYSGNIGSNFPAINLNLPCSSASWSGSSSSESMAPADIFSQTNVCALTVEAAEAEQQCEGGRGDEKDINADISPSSNKNEVQKKERGSRNFEMHVYSHDGYADHEEESVLIPSTFGIMEGGVSLSLPEASESCDSAPNSHSQDDLQSRSLLAMSNIGTMEGGVSVILNRSSTREGSCFASSPQKHKTPPILSASQPSMGVRVREVIDLSRDSLGTVHKRQRTLGSILGTGEIDNYNKNGDNDDCDIFAGICINKVSSSMPSSSSSLSVAHLLYGSRAHPPQPVDATMQRVWGRRPLPAELGLSPTGRPFRLDLTTSHSPNNDSDDLDFEEDEALKFATVANMKRKEAVNRGNRRVAAAAVASRGCRTKKQNESKSIGAGSIASTNFSAFASKNVSFRSWEVESPAEPNSQSNTSLNNQDSSHTQIPSSMEPEETVVLRYIRSMPELHEQVILFEPLDFDALHSRLQTIEGFRIAKLKLRAILDKNAIFVSMNK